MKAYQVVWHTPKHTSLLTGFTLMPETKIFGSKEKADDFVKKLREAAFVLNLFDIVNPRIIELEVE